MAMLCGHTAAIADLEACMPGKLYDASGTQLISGSGISVVCGAVVSACVEGWLCLWDGITGRCRRRRRLPPWVGSPSIMTALPSVRRYICVACNGANVGLSQTSSFKDGYSEVKNVGDRGNKGMERVGSMKSSTRGAVVVVDSLTLVVLHVVYNGVLGMGPINAMILIPESESRHKLMVSDLFGKIRTGTVDQRKLVKGESVVEKSENSSGNSPKSCITGFETAQTTSISLDGQYLLMVFASYWIIVYIADCKEVVRMENGHCKNERCLLAGGFFLVNSNENFMLDTKDSDKRIQFVIWDMDGTAVLYSLFNLDEKLGAKASCQIVAMTTTKGGEYNMKLCQWQECIICVGSERLRPEMFPCETWVRLWYLPMQLAFNYEILPSMSPLNDYFSEDGLTMPKLSASSTNQDIATTHSTLWDFWLACSFNSLTQEADCLEKENVELRELDTNLTSKSKTTPHQTYERGRCNSNPSSLAVGSVLYDHGRDTKADREKRVTASMLLSRSSSVPSAVAFGYNTGEIRLVELQAIEPSFSSNESGSPVDIMSKRQAMQCFTKHTGPILCLAEHSRSPQSFGSSSSESEGPVLISGSFDCLLCIWDLRRRGEILAVLRHHVAPVRQILLPPPGTDPPWSSCFISAGEDGCVALISLETLQVERMFPGHFILPRVISWDGVRGYIACLCSRLPVQVVGSDVLYIWDLKSGALERDPRGAAAHSMFDYFLKRTQGNSLANSLLPGRSTSTSSLLHGEEDSPRLQLNEPPRSGLKTGTVGSSNSIDQVKVIGSLEKLSSRFSQVFNHGNKAGSGKNKSNANIFDAGTSQRDLFHKQQPMKGACPFPGVAALQFDLFALMAPNLGRMRKSVRESQPTKTTSLSLEQTKGTSGTEATKETLIGEISKEMIYDSEESNKVEALSSELDKPQLMAWFSSSEGHLLRMSLSFLHLWGADLELDRLLEKDLLIFQPSQLGVAVGLAGDRGAMTLMLPGWRPSFELWKVSPEFCALRSLTIVAVAQRMLTSSRPTSHVSSALAAFYTRGLAEKYPDVAAPSLELYACFWQDPSEHVRMAARSLFHCAAARAIPIFLLLDGSFSTPSDSQDCNNGPPCADDQILLNNCLIDASTRSDVASIGAEIGEWIESFEGQDWTAIVGGTSQDARAVRIIVGAALAVWYPRLVKPNLAICIAPYLVNLVKAVIDRHSATAAELLADGMEAIWQPLIYSQIPQLISDIFLLIECLSGGTVSNSSFSHNPATAMTIRETLTGSLLPSLAMTDVFRFLELVQRQLSVASSGSPIHIVSLMTIIRIVRGAPRDVVPFLFQVTSIILQTMETGKHCFQSAMAAVREMIRVFPMVALHRDSGKLAVGGAIGDVRSLVIEVYDLNSVTKLKVLDASGPPGHPALQVKDGAPTTTVGISALAFSQDGEGLVAFSLQGLTLRWWSLGAVWWEKLSRATVPVQCTKLVLVPPWAGFSPKSSRSSIMATISKSYDMRSRAEEQQKGHINEGIVEKMAAQTFDLSYRLEWKEGKKVALLHHGLEVGIFQI